MNFLFKIYGSVIQLNLLLLLIKYNKIVNCMFPLDLFLFTNSCFHIVMHFPFPWLTCVYWTTLTILKFQMVDKNQWQFFFFLSFFFYLKQKPGIMLPSFKGFLGIYPLSAKCINCCLRYNWRFWYSLHILFVEEPSLLPQQHQVKL